tara:strand:- start:6 stop:584 length:579 start_codon:yes stop_codon:yes gene_type:complete
LDFYINSFNNTLGIIKYQIMENNNDSFNREEHLVPSLKAAVYYLLVYIPLLLPLAIWKNAAVSLAKLWRTRSVSFENPTGKYPLWSMLYNYLVTFVFDSAILLAWALGLYQALFEIKGYEVFNYMDFFPAMKTMLIGLLTIYTSVIFLKLAKESLNFILENLITWILDVIRSIGQMLVNIWKLNIVIRRKGE